jgi:hypothetical protein
VVVIFIEISYSLEMVEDQTQIVSNLKVGVLQSLPAERKPSADKKTESLCTISSSLLGKCSFLCTSTKCHATSPEALCLVLNTRKKKALRHHDADTRSPVMRCHMWKFICNLKIFTLTRSGSAAGNVVDFHFGEHVHTST